MEMQFVEVLFKKDLYPKRAGETGRIRKDFALGQFKDYVEIVETAKTAPQKREGTPDDTTLAEGSKNVADAPSNKSMSGRKSKKTK